MAKKLGKILFPEQYAPVGKEVVVSNSLEALAFFEDYYPKGGIVLLGSLRLGSLEFPELPVWLYFDIKSKEPTLYSTLPVFNADMEKFNNLQILDIIPHEDEVFTQWNGTLYSSIFTSKGEIVIKKVRLLADQTNATLVLETQFSAPVTDMLPVELYSHSEKRFIGVCWACQHGFEDDCIYWHPVCLEDVEMLESYPPEDLSDYPIEVGETAVIGGDTYRLYHTEETGFYFRKLSGENAHNILRARFKEYAKKHGSAPKAGTGSQKPIILPINLKK